MNVKLDSLITNEFEHTFYTENKNVCLIFNKTKKK